MPVALRHCEPGTAISTLTDRRECAWLVASAAISALTKLKEELGQ